MTEKPDPQLYSERELKEWEEYNKEMEEAGLKDEQLLESVSAILATPQGEFFFRWLFSRTRVFSSDFCLGAQVYRNSERRNVGLEVFHLMYAVAPHKLHRLITLNPELLEEESQS